MIHATLAATLRVGERTSSAGVVNMSGDEEQSTSLPASRAFVLQIRADSRVENGHLAGRVEHVVSGRSAHFQSVDELLTFMASALREADTSGPEEFQ